MRKLRSFTNYKCNSRPLLTAHQKQPLNVVVAATAAGKTTYRCCPAVTEGEHAKAEMILSHALIWNARKTMSPWKSSTFMPLLSARTASKATRNLTRCHATLAASKYLFLLFMCCSSVFVLFWCTDHKLHSNDYRKYLKLCFQLGEGGWERTERTTRLKSGWRRTNVAKWLRFTCDDEQMHVARQERRGHA